MFGRRIKLDSGLYEQVRRAAAEAGYASPAEFVRHVLEREAARVAKAGPRASDELIERRLRGLGYLD